MTKVLDQTPYEGRLYVLLFSDKRIKVGQSNDAEKRVEQHRHHAIVYGVSIEREWISPVHVDYVANETALINWARSAAKSVVGREYFVGLDFDRVVAVARSLPMLRQTVEQKAEKDGKAEGLVDIVKAMWGLPTINPVTLNGRRLPMESDAEYGATLPIDAGKGDTWTQVELGGGAYVLAQFTEPGILQLSTMVRHQDDQYSDNAESVNLDRAGRAELIRV